MAFHAVQHAREREIRQTRASGNGVMAGSAIDVELVFLFKMRAMGKPNVHILSRYGDGSNHPAGFGESGVFNFLRRMTAAAPLGVEGCIQLWLHAWLGMAGGALRVSGKFGENALLVELVTEGAIGAEAGCRVNAGLLIHVHRVRELKQDGARRFVAWK